MSCAVITPYHLNSWCHWPLSVWLYPIHPPCSRYALPLLSWLQRLGCSDHSQVATHKYNDNAMLPPPPPSFTQWVVSWHEAVTQCQWLLGSVLQSHHTVTRNLKALSLSELKLYWLGHRLISNDHVFNIYQLSAPVPIIHIILESHNIVMGGGGAALEITHWASMCHGEVDKM